MNNIPVVILAGGTGTRLREMTELIPKPLIPIGGKPMIWHIMKLYSHYGFHKFILALGHKQEQFKLYFHNYDIINYDTLISTAQWIIKPPKILEQRKEQWHVLLVDTGEHTLKEGRIAQIGKYIDEDTFLLTYGDGIGNIDINALLSFHIRQNKMVTVTGISPVSRFGELKHQSGEVYSFKEKPTEDGCLTSAGFFVCNKKILNYLVDDGLSDFEATLGSTIVPMKELGVFEHKGFWRGMDTLKDMEELRDIWNTGTAPWKVWES